jgi:ABC-type polysaccharide/polyol phosphate export permease
MLKDFYLGLIRWPIWITLAWEDICQRYRRNTIGPFWITLSNGVTIGAMAFLFTNILDTNVNFFVPYLTAGMTFWSFISSLVSEATTVFLSARNIMLSIPLPLSCHVLRMVVRNLIIFLHVVVVYIFVALYYHVNVNMYTLMIIPALLLTLINSLWFGILFGMLCARFRDLSQIIMSLLGVSMYVTPIFWDPSSLKDKIWLLNLNPFYSILLIVRDALLGNPPNALAYEICTALAIVGLAGAAYVYKRYRNDVIFWL